MGIPAKVLFPPNAATQPAFAAVTFYEDRPLATIENLWVDKTYQGQGLATALFQEVVTTAKTRGVDYILTDPRPGSRQPGTVNIMGDIPSRSVQYAQELAKIQSFLRKMNFKELTPQLSDQYVNFGTWAYRV